MYKIKNTKKKISIECVVNSLDNLIDKIPVLKTFLEKTRIRDTREKYSKLRTLYINHIKPDGYVGEEPLNYANNTIITSKYTVLNFLPKNLFEQFRRIANFYFLINIVILFLIPDPPSNPYTAIFPLVIVIGVTAIKQAYEDILRHKADWEVNSKQVRVLKQNGKFESIKSKDIKCGDIVQVKIDENFPCDLVLLYSNSDTGSCYIKTSNLDGETNLKQRSIPFKFPQLENEMELNNLRGALIYEKPNTKLYEFKGKLLSLNKEFTITNENILLRGTSLKIAPVIYGCAIYTGKDTKMMLNSKFKRNKLSCVEKRLNYFVFSYIIVLVIISIFCLIGSFLFDHIYKKHWYMTNPKFYHESRSLYHFITFVSFMNLNYIIPLSLYVTMELTRVLGSRFFQWDLKMYDDKTDQPAVVNSTDLNEDLGQIEYLFTDKTGTLTENEMIFKHFCINGKYYEEIYGELYRVGSQIPESLKNSDIKRFLEALSVCHTVQIDKTSSEKYNASSPDELSFIKFCLNLGIIFEGDRLNKKDDRIIRKVLYDLKEGLYEKKYEILHILEFDSNRKRMSIMVKNLESNEYMLYCKGADSSLINCCTCGTYSKYEDCLNKFSEKGWRTLMLAYKVLNESEFFEYTNLLEEAYSDILNKDAKLSKAYELIETDLRIIGVTSVEDRLQQDVEATLFALRQAGIKIWVLTGDKLETAINISDSCKHFSKEMIKFVLKNLNKQQEIKDNFSIISEQINLNTKQSYALVIDGVTVEHVFQFNLQNDFRSISMKCKAVLCCRMSPSQKARIVNLIKLSQENPMTAAIGDGANDVSMIQEAHVGLGIFGKEGRNAARSADFSFSKFKFLKRAFLVHGYLYYSRASILVLYFFYKNFIFAICQSYYAYWNGFSSTSLYASLFISVYNLALNSVPPVMIALFEQKNSPQKLENNPFLYKTISKNKSLSALEFIKWNIIAIWHSLVAFFATYGLFSKSSNLLENGKMMGSYQFGSLVLFILFLISHVKIFLIWKYQNIFALISYIASLLGFILVCIITNSFITPFPITLFTEDQSMYYNFHVLLSSGSVWFCVLLAIVVSILPDLILIFYDSLKETLLESKNQNELNFTKPISQTFTVTENISLNSMSSKLFNPVNPNQNQNLTKNNYSFGFNFFDRLSNFSSSNLSRNNKVASFVN